MLTFFGDFLAALGRAVIFAIYKKKPRNIYQSQR